MIVGSAKPCSGAEAGQRWDRAGGRIACTDWLVRRRLPDWVDSPSGVAAVSTEGDELTAVVEFLACQCIAVVQPGDCGRTGSSRWDSWVHSRVLSTRKVASPSQAATRASHSDWSVWPEYRARLTWPVRQISTMKRSGVTFQISCRSRVIFEISCHSGQLDACPGR